MVTITIKTDNAAFQDGNRVHELARILRVIAANMERHDQPLRVHDANGNECGRVELTGADR